ncbi:hypothetical protein I8752_13500 [Nostocaceae cyanobacterium CENA369]|uniref:Uncharacterized protein n=1 Tax=Dendronalium phyllosphericum CENA369 TaxID=1725256 RepID=A0A8J7I114_9NOST|nr:hypothetical protein [Dendronalium phyllosphericum]MBH8574020.1 hypothetical protein [Dendronalium phyllosphericum CENA369]
MSKVIISDLRPPDVKIFMHELTPAEAETVFGGGLPYISITNITDKVTINGSGFTKYGGDDTVEGGTNSTSFHDNKINTMDYSRSNYNMFFY